MLGINHASKKNTHQSCTNLAAFSQCLWNLPNLGNVFQKKICAGWPKAKYFGELGSKDERLKLDCMPRGEAAKDWRMSRCVSAMHSIIFTKTQFISEKKSRDVEFMRWWFHEMFMAYKTKTRGQIMSKLFCSTPGLASLISLATVTAAKVGRTKVLWKGLFGKDDWLRFKLPFPSSWM